MAKRGRKSAAIRDVLAANPQATPKEIAANLKARRIQVSTALISQVKYGANGKARKSNGVTFDQLLAAKALVARVGSVDVAKSALDALSKLI